MKTLDEVKDALIKCNKDLCKECAYNGEYQCANMLKHDAFLYLDSYSSYKGIIQAEQERLKYENIG